MVPIGKLQKPFTSSAARRRFSVVEFTLALLFGTLLSAFAALASLEARTSYDLTLTAQAGNDDSFRAGTRKLN